MKCVDLKLETAVEVVGFVGTPAGPVVGVCVNPVTGALYSREITELADLGTIPNKAANPRVDAKPRVSIDEAVHEGLTKGEKNANHRRR